MTEEKKWRFGPAEMWSLGDLTDAEREIAENAGCDEEKYYCGEPSIENEVGCCPICNSPTNFDLRCEHFAFYYDRTNGEYKELSPAFRTILKQMFSEIRLQSLSNADELPDDLPSPEELEEKVEALRTYSSHDQWGVHGFVFGYIDVEESCKQGSE